MRSRKIRPLSVEHIIKENYYHQVYQLVFEYITSIKPSIEKFSLLNKMKCANKYITGSYISLLPKMPHEMFYNYILKLDHFLNNYNKNASYFKQVLDGLKRKQITLYIIPRTGQYIKIIIQPWRSVIETKKDAFYYDKFYKTFLEIIKDIDIKNVLSIQLNSNIRSLDRTLFKY